jgi:hypothetical protein
MDRLIWIAWRAFWVGLGASGVLIAQSLIPRVAPPPGPPTPGIVVPAPAEAKPLEQAVRSTPGRPGGRDTSAARILSRSPFDSKAGPLVRPRV